MPPPIDHDERRALRRRADAYGNGGDEAEEEERQRVTKADKLKAAKRKLRRWRQLALAIRASR